ncbi:MAG: BRCT domain-containing protein, partial [Patescibacteria group bacterium]
SITRDETKRRIRDAGGNVAESVSRKTDYVIVGADPGSKFNKAQELGVKTLNEKEFLKLLG